MLANVAFWAFGASYATSIGIFLLSFERMRLGVNSTASIARLSWKRPLGESSTLEEALRKKNLIAFFFETLDQYRFHYPTSPLPQVAGISLVGALLSFLGIIASGIALG